MKSKKKIDKKFYQANTTLVKLNKCIASLDARSLFSVEILEELNGTPFISIRKSPVYGNVDLSRNEAEKLLKKFAKKNTPKTAKSFWDIAYKI